MRKSFMVAGVVALGFTLAPTGQISAQDGEPAPKPLPPVSNALDTDQDRALSTQEIIDAGEALLALDANGNGVLDHNEVGANPRNLPMARLEVALNVIDVDGDVRISPEEMDGASDRLRLLDKNKNWRIETSELLRKAAPVGEPDTGDGARSGQRPPRPPEFVEAMRRFTAYTTSLEGRLTPGSDPREYSGFTLIHEAGSGGQIQQAIGTYLLDPAGRRVHEWTGAHNYPEGSNSYLLPDGNLLRSYSENHWIEDKLFPVGAWSSLELLDWNGNVLWQFGMSEPGRYSFHHDMEYLPNGNILVIRYDGYSTEEMIAMGWDQSLGEKAKNRIDKDGSGILWLESVLELKPDLEDGSTDIVWQWSAADHLVQDEFPDRQNYGDTTDPGKIDINYLDLDKDVPFNSGQILHMNAVDYDPRNDLIMVSVATFGEVWIIDHSASWDEARGDSGGHYGAGGAILFRFGNDEAFGSGTRDESTLYWQHDAQFIDEGLPGEGNLLVYNNGTRRNLDDTYQVEAGPLVLGSYTNILEVDLPSDGEGKFDPTAEPEIVWNWEAENRADFFSPFMSGANRQPNGNTTFVRAFDKWIFEVTADGTIVLDYSLEGWGRIHRVKKYSPDFTGLRFAHCEHLREPCPIVRSPQPWDGIEASN